MTQHILFEASGLDLAVPAQQVRHIHEQLSVEKLAGTHDWFLGLAVSRGRLVPVSDLGAFMGRQPCTGRILELTVDTSLAALRVGEVAGVSNLQAVEEEQPIDVELHRNNLALTGRMVRAHGREHHVLNVTALVHSPAFTNIKETLS